MILVVPVRVAAFALAAWLLAALACAQPPERDETGRSPDVALDVAADSVAGAPVLEAVNAHRVYEGSPPLRPDGRLQATAEAVLAEIEERGTTRNVDLGISAFVDRLRRRGYVERRLVVGTVAGGSPEDVAQRWPDVDPELWQRLLEPELRDIGIAVGWKGRDPFVLVLAGVSQAQNLAERGAELELDRVRDQILAWTNELRARRGLWELRSNETLDAVAQSYAEDMIVRGFYGHESPEGSSVMDRVLDGGYAARNAGENLAQGTADAREVYDGWVESPGHRANLLFPGFRHLGVGMAQGWSDDGGYRIVWVQVFGRGR